MFWKNSSLFLAAALPSILAAQEAGQPGARAMYFAGLESSTPAARRPPAKKAPVVAPPKPSGEPQNPARPPGGGAVVIPAAAVKPYLGLRYSILKVEGTNATEVPSETRFQSGDAVRLRVQTNSDGYLYIVHRGTSGNWSVLFPSRSHQSPKVEAGGEYTLPPNSTFRFRGAPGIEKMFVVLSRQPESSLDEIIQSVRQKAGDPLLLAQASPIGDPLINGLRRSYNRDMVIEDAPGEGEQRDLAVYVVNSSAASDSRVVADIQFIHQ